MFNRTDSFQREPRFKSQHPHQVSQPLLTPVQGICCILLTLTLRYSHDAWTEFQIKYPSTKNKKIKKNLKNSPDAILKSEEIQQEYLF